jgi:hypothetical protein
MASHGLFVRPMYSGWLREVAMVVRASMKRKTVTLFLQ